MYITVHVDDIIVASTDIRLINRFEQEMNKLLVMKSLGDLQYYLGLQYEQEESGIFLVHQKYYIEKKLQEFNLSDSRPSKIPIDPEYVRNRKMQENSAMKNSEVYRKAIGSLLYLANNTRPDIAVGTSILARCVSDPKQSDWTEVKRMFHYLNYTKDKKLKLGNVQEQDSQQLIGYADADWGNNVIDRKSNSGYLLKYLGAPITWASRKQSLVSLSSTEAEYIALTECVQEALWVRRILDDFNQDIEQPIVIFEDNQSCVKMLQKDKTAVSQRTKHIATKYHFIRDLYQSQIVDVRYLPSEQMIADLLTKPLGAQKIVQLLKDILI